MDLKIISTGSKGNVIYVGNSKGGLFVDMGLPKTKANNAIIESGIMPDTIQGILLTHEHSDHIKGISFADKWNIPVFGSEGTLKMVPVQSELKTILNPYEFSKVGDFEVLPFKTYHNSYDGFGYVISDGEQQASVLLDTGKVTDEMIGYMMDSNIILIESNHDRDMVVMSDYPLSVQERNLSDLGHLSNEQAAEALFKIVTGNGERILLAHLSSKCNSPDLAKYAVKQELKKKGFLEGTHYHLEVK